MASCVLPMGTITAFDVPGTGQALGTVPESINTEGTISGYYDGEGAVTHAFVRAANGTISTFTVPSAGKSTTAASINAAGVIAGKI